MIRCAGIARPTARSAGGVRSGLSLGSRAALWAEEGKQEVHAEECPCVGCGESGGTEVSPDLALGGG